MELREMFAPAVSFIVSDVTNAQMTSQAGGVHRGRHVGRAGRTSPDTSPSSPSTCSSLERSPNPVPSSFYESVIS